MYGYTGHNTRQTNRCRGSLDPEDTRPDWNRDHAGPRCLPLGGQSDHAHLGWAPFGTHTPYPRYIPYLYHEGKIPQVLILRHFFGHTVGESGCDLGVLVARQPVETETLECGRGVWCPDSVRNQDSRDCFRRSSEGATTSLGVSSSLDSGDATYKQQKGRKVKVV